MACSFKSVKLSNRFSLSPISSPKQSKRQYSNQQYSSSLQHKFTTKYRTQRNANSKLFTFPKFRSLTSNGLITSRNGTSLLLAMLGLFGFGLLSNEASAQSDLNDTEERLYDQVMDALAEGDYAKARGLVAQRLEEKPACRAGLYIKGFLLMQQGRYQEALGSFDAVIVLSPDWADTYAKRAECLIALGRLQDALRTLNYVINRFPSWHEPKYLKVETLLRMRKAEAAERILDDLLQAGSWTQQSLYLKAALSYANSDYARSLLFADEAYDLNNNFVDAMVLKGLSLDAMEYHEPAVECFSKALRVAENRDTADLVTKPQAIGQVMNNLVGLMTTLNQEEKAVQCRQKLTEQWLAMVATKDQ